MGAKLDLDLIPNKNDFKSHADWEEAVHQWMGTEKIITEDGVYT